MKAVNRCVERVFDLEGWEEHWGKCKLSRDPNAIFTGPGDSVRRAVYHACAQKGRRTDLNPVRRLLRLRLAATHFEHRGGNVRRPRLFRLHYGQEAGPAAARTFLVLDGLIRPARCTVENLTRRVRLAIGMDASNCTYRHLGTRSWVRLERTPCSFQVWGSVGFKNGAWPILRRRRGTNL
jgi:hypothetical protein